MGNVVIQGLWVGDALSTLERLSLSSFLKHRHEYHLYTYGEVANIPEGVVIKDANRIVPEKDIFYLKSGAGKGSVAPFADMFRYKLLLEVGGWWADTDCVCVQPFDFTREYVFSSEYGGNSNSGVPNNGVIKAPSGSDAAEYCYRESMAMDRNSIQWSETGPKLIASALSKYGLNDYVQHPQVFCPLACQALPYMLVSDASIFNLEGAYTIHFWNELWRRYRIDKNAVYPPESLFERLKRQYL
jgi:hypothetical protein